MTIVRRAKAACLLPFYLDERVFSERMKNIDKEIGAGVMTVEKDPLSKAVTLHLRKLEIGSEELGITSACQPSIVVYLESYLPNKHVAILVLMIEFDQENIELSILLRFFDTFRRIQTRNTFFSVSGLPSAPSQLPPKDIVQFLLDTVLPTRETIEGIKKMIALPIVEMIAVPLDDDLYKLATISDPDEVLASDYVGEFLHQNAYRRWQDSGATWVFHRNAAAFVIDGSNEHFIKWRTKKPAALETSIERHISSARLLIFQKAVLYRLRDDIRNLRFDKDRRKLLTRIEELREHTLKFTNQYRYSEEVVDGTMTVEILKMWRKVMLVDALFSEVYEKLSELEQYMVTVTADDQTRAISWLQVFFVGGTAGAIAASLLALTSNLVISAIGTVVTIVLFGLLTWLWLRWCKAL